jgi:hypothetical protein
MLEKEKFNKIEVGYLYPNSIPFKCRTCTHWCSDHSCVEVSGIIQPNGNCDIFYFNEEEKNVTYDR